MMLWLWLALIGCGSGADSQRGAVRRALAHADKAEALLSDGRAVEATAELERAHEDLPDDPVIAAWLARALATQGELARAIDLLARVVAAHPDFATARYNRAAYLARAGRMDEAAVDLQRAIRDGARPARDVLDDPDFAPWLEHSALAFLPGAALSVGVERPEGAVFWGSELVIELRVHGAGDRPLDVTAERASGPVHLVRVSEDFADSTDGPSRSIAYALRVDGEGGFDVEGLSVSAAGREGTTRAFVAPLAAPPGRSASPVTVDLRTPSAALRDIPAGALAVRRGDDVWVRLKPGERLDTSPELASDARVPYLLHKRGVLDASAWRLAGAPPNLKVIARRGRNDPVREQLVP